MPPLALFDVDDARHYCRTFNTSAGLSLGSIDAFMASMPGTRLLREATLDFDHYRDCSLRDAERRLFMAVSHYRRSLDLMTPGAAWWAHVTLYYGSFFAASALLAMFGARVLKGRRIEVNTGAAGHQALSILGGWGSTHTGSHQRFWDIFYSSALALIPVVNPPLRIGLSPVTARATWQTETRNLINYDTHHALQVAEQFEASFDKQQFPGSLPGLVQTQFAVCEALVLIALSFAKDFGLATDALGALGPAGTRRTKLRRLVFDPRPPGLVRKIKRSQCLV